MKIGDEIYVHGYLDEIRQDTVIIRNDGGYFGTALSEMREATREEREGVDEYINSISEDVREKIGVGKNYNPKDRTESSMTILGDVLKEAYCSGYADGLSDRIKSDYDRGYDDGRFHWKDWRSAVGQKINIDAGIAMMEEKKNERT